MSVFINVRTLFSRVYTGVHTYQNVEYPFSSKNKIIEMILI